jgi:hypothetical protein
MSMPRIHDDCRICSIYVALRFQMGGGIQLEGLPVPNEDAALVAIQP